MKCCFLLVTILLWLFTFVNCEKICSSQKSGKKRCCINFKYVNGKCIECPKGSFGEDCTSQCPAGLYGVGCKETCDCTHDQICDVLEGCVQNKTADCPKGWFGEECKLPCPDGNYGLSCKGTCNCTTDQICDIREGCVQNKTESTSDIIDTTSTEQQTTKSSGYNDGLYWYQLFGIPLGVVIIVMILLTVHTHWKWKISDQESESQHNQQPQEARSQAIEINKITEESDYDEICEFDTGCSHTHTFANDFNEISRGKEVNQLQQKTSAILHLDAIAR